ncbi:MAG: GntR family transcriptional regulator [Rhizobiales bacterium 65-9]|nr:GntR family transcriptional regulator [Hyphomicrobiales bacterium]OJY38969.1 MAG: GntR family transcriptional regulator [Rhizobiales bacterium 65-9]
MSTVKKPADRTATKDAPESIVERVYEQVKALSISFDLLPGDRVNEIELAERLGVSRTPLREALNRLTADGFLTMRPGKGFFRRPLDAKEIFDLYEFRRCIESANAPLAIARATPEKIAAIRAFLDISRADVPERTVTELVELDEQFHEKLMALSGNAEMLRVLRNLNSRIRFVRWIDMENLRRQSTQQEHLAILDAVAAGDEKASMALLNEHIERRLDQIVAVIREGYARIYMNRASAAGD